MSVGLPTPSRLPGQGERVSQLEEKPGQRSTGEVLRQHADSHSEPTFPAPLSHPHFPPSLSLSSDLEENWLHMLLNLHVSHQARLLSSAGTPV